MPTTNQSREVVVEGPVHGPVVGESSGVIKTIYNYVITPLSVDADAKRNRDRMLAKVRDSWVRDVLHKSLHRATLIALGMEYAPGAVTNPWGLLVQQLEQRPLPIAPRASIAAVFEYLGGELLIMGTPGAGKTTLLLDLARSLLLKAKQDDTMPIPVVFNLASWSQKRQSIGAWLVDELNVRYGVPHAIAQTWVKHDQLLLLLDGLDEVKSEYRESCVQALNAFRRDHGLVKLAICSRTEEYETLSTRLKLQGAIRIQPLTPQQVDRYIHVAGGEQLRGLRAALHADAMLRELAQSPLMLNIMMIVYKDVDVKLLDMQGSAEERRTDLFTAYVNHMFARRSVDARYTQEQTITWLEWLASGLSQKNQTLFLIEGLQPDWLPTATARITYTVVDRVGMGLGLGLGLALLIGLMTGLAQGPTVGVGFGFVYLLVGALITGLFVDPYDLSVRTRRSNWLVAGSTLLGAVIVGLFGALAMEVAFGSVILPSDAFISGVTFGLTGGLAGWLSGGPSIQPRGIAVVERLRWRPRRALRAALIVLMGGMLLSFTISLLAPSLMDLGEKIMTGLINALIFGIVFGLVGGLVGGFTGVEVEAKVTPNQGIIRSIRSAIFIGLLCTVGFGFVVLLGLGWESSIIDPLLRATRIGLVFGLVTALAYGGYACVSHFALRLVLWQRGDMPWRYARFLDFAAERIFLHKVGGGYIFVHRLLQEFFAKPAADPNLSHHRHDGQRAGSTIPAKELEVGGR